MNDLRTGRLVVVAGSIRLVDDYGNWWPIEYVSILTGAWGFDADGAVKHPRLWRYDANGNVSVEGDVVLIEFLGGEHSRPLVRGGVARIDRDAWLGGLDLEDERLRAQVVPRNTSGQVLGRARVEVGESVEVSQLGAGGVRQARVTLGADGVGLEGPGLLAAESVIRGETYLRDEATAAAEEAAVLAVVAGFFGVPLTQVPVRAATLATSAAGKVPYLSTAVKAE